MDFEALWTYQTEDLKAEAIATEIKRSPTRIKLERSRDFILDRQKQYKQIEDSIAGLADRKEMLEEALSRAVDRLNQLQGRLSGVDPDDEDAVSAMIHEVGDAREELHSFEMELNHMNGDAAAYDKQLRSVRVEAAKAKQAFDQLKVDYENESKAKKEELEAQRARAKALEASVDADLLAELRLDTLLGLAFEEEIDALYEMLSPYVEADPSAFYTKDEFTEACQMLKLFCLKRTQSVRAQLDGVLSTRTDEQNVTERIDASDITVSVMGSHGGGQEGQRRFNDGPDRTRP